MDDFGDFFGPRTLRDKIQTWIINHVGLWTTLEWWKYVLDDSRARKDYGTYFSRCMCRRRGHGQVVFYNPGGYEPDMHCMDCGEDLD